MNEQLQGATTQTASAQPLFNPLSPDFIRDPYPSYDKLRTHAPVLHLPALNGYLVSRNADAALVLRDKRFGKDYVTRITRRFGPEALVLSLPLASLPARSSPFFPTRQSS